MKNQNLETNSNKQVANYGTWDSPFTPELITKGAKHFIDVAIDGSDVYWVERRPEESGRSVIMHKDKNGTVKDVTPNFTKGDTDFFNVRTRVHEYGGSSFIVKDKTIYFVNFKDQIIYKQKLKNLILKKTF